MEPRTATWIRLAGSAQTIREGGTHHWRCYVNRTGEAIPLISFKFSGAANDTNVIPGTAPKRDEPNGLTAWIDAYGHLDIKNDVAVITLRPGI